MLSHALFHLWVFFYERLLSWLVSKYSLLLFTLFGREVVAILSMYGFSSMRAALVMACLENWLVVVLANFLECSKLGRATISPAMLRQDDLLLFTQFGREEMARLVDLVPSINLVA